MKKSHENRCKLNPTKWKQIIISTSSVKSFAWFSGSTKIATALNSVWPSTFHPTADTSAG